MPVRIELWGFVSRGITDLWLDQPTVFIGSYLAEAS